MQYSPIGNINIRSNFLTNFTSACFAVTDPWITESEIEH